MSNRLDIIRGRQTTEELLLKLKSENEMESKAAGAAMVAKAKAANLSMRNYLRLAIDTSKGEFKDSGLTGYEAALAYLGLPIKEDFDAGVVLELAAETFQTFPGTRALFPEVIDDLIQYKYRQDQLIQVAPMLANSRTITQPEVQSTVVDDAEDDHQFTQPIAEGSRVPIRSIRMGEHTVKIFKHGSGLEWTYEFERRATIDIITPYAARIEREKEISKANCVTDLLVNGDSVHAAADTVSQNAIKPAGHSTSAAGQINWECLLQFLVDRAKAGVPIDSFVGNWDTFAQWQLMFARPDINEGMTKTEVLAKAGVNVAKANPNFDFNINFNVSTTAPTAKLVGFSKDDTVEELVEAGSQIQESERSIENQMVKMVRTDNTGYRLVFGDTRAILDLDQVT